MRASRANTIGYTKAVRALRAQAQTRADLVSFEFLQEMRQQASSGVLTPQIRKLAREFYMFPLPDVRKLMHSNMRQNRHCCHSVKNCHVPAATETFVLQHPSKILELEKYGSGELFSENGEKFDSVNENLRS